VLVVAVADPRVLIGNTTPTGEQSSLPMRIPAPIIHKLRFNEPLSKDDLDARIGSQGHNC
jgi:hypothetical protein